MGRKIDLTGQRFGKWTVLREAEERTKNGKTQWECLCDCGNKKIIRGSNLRSGSSKSCGCLRSPDIVEQRFGKWTVIGKTKLKDKWGAILWDCLCECGTRKNVAWKDLKRGNTKSCGCSNYGDIRGKSYGMLKLIRHTGDYDTFGNELWECLCECGSLKIINKYSVLRGRTKSCGCLHKEVVTTMMYKRRGHLHPSYNPKITDDVRMKNRYQLGGKSVINWRKEIFSNDDFICQSCNQRGYKLNAHHLNSWNAFPEQRFDTANGITLCEDCHKEFHHFYGKGDNTLEQFRDHIACTVGEEYVSEIEETLLSRESEIIGQEELEQKEIRELQTT